MDDATEAEMKPVQHAYAKALDDLISSGKYDNKDDFTVVLQPFMWEVKVPKGVSSI